MPDFKVSLRDVDGKISISHNGTVIQIADYSNYIASTESGNEKVDFNWSCFIIVTNPDLTKNIINLSPQPYHYTTVPHITSYSDFKEDGLYKINLISLPSFDAGKDYVFDDINGVTDYVWANELYKCIVSHTSTMSFYTEVAAGMWELVDVSENYDAIPSKYNTTEYFSLNLFILRRSREYSIELADIINDNGVNTELMYADPVFITTWKSYICANALDDINDTELFTATEVIANLAHSLL